MELICQGELSNGMSVEVHESGAILSKEVLIKIEGANCEVFQISSQKRGKAKGFAISPKIKRPQFIETIPDPDIVDPPTKPATLSDIA
jgi:hypothetical protein